MNEHAESPSGVLILDKPQGITSHDAVYRIRRLYGTKKVGHTGTLDPMATGVLVMLIGRATKAAEFIAADRKMYEAKLLLGVSTDTLDTEGAVLRTCKEIPCEEEVLASVKKFVGSYGQVPPMYSAIKRNGQKMVDLARRGVTVDLPPRGVTVYGVRASMISHSEYALSVECSAGTYIRSLCRDIGDDLGCGGVMSGLRRIRSGDFDVAYSVTLDALEKMSEAERVSLLLPVESLFSASEEVILPEFFAALASNGQPVYQKKIRTDYPDGTRLRLSDSKGFFALGEACGEVIKPVKQFRI